MTTGVWVELMDDAEIGAALDDVATAGLYVCIATPSERVGDAALARLTRRAAERGVVVRLWPLLPREQGYWIGETNAERARELIGELRKWRTQPEGAVFDAVSIDLEPDYAYSEELREAQRSDPMRWVSLLRSHIDRAAFERARGVLGRAVDEARRDGIVCHAVTYPLVLDQPEGSLVIEDALDIPVTGIAWDEISVMAYQTAYAQQAGTWFGPALVHAYATDAVARWGARAGFDLGVVGDAGLGLDPGDRYPDPAALRADVAAVLAAGVPLARIRIYGLKGAVLAGGVARWLELRDVQPVAPPSSKAVARLRKTVAGLAVGLTQP